MLKRFLSWARDHSVVVFLLYVLILSAVIVASLEIYLRASLRYNPSYYVALSDPRPGTVLEYPYGIIKINSDGYPDDDFDVIKSRPRIAYIGDSNCYGVGAGHGYRVTELLEEAFPDFEHMNLSAGIGSSGITEMEKPQIFKEVDRFDIDLVVYIMSLNDVLPDQDAVRADGSRFTTHSLINLREYTDWLRGRSYLYTHVRTILKNYVVRLGYEIEGQRMYELFPEEERNVFVQTARRIDGIAQELEARGVGFVVLVLPYEMQISRDAASTYESLDIEWEPEFLDRGAQRALLGSLSHADAVDLYGAFISDDDPSRTIDTIKVGELFVYNKGDKLDWHHPNRAGHRLMADYLIDDPTFRRVLDETRSSFTGTTH